ncbi:MAG: hypothetical protein ABJC51_02505, partial [Acidobacteriota bacterium]
MSFLLLIFSRGPTPANCQRSPFGSRRWLLATSFDSGEALLRELPALALGSRRWLRATSLMTADYPSHPYYPTDPSSETL